LRLRNCSSSPKPHHDDRSPAQIERHAGLHDAALFLGGNGRLLLLLIVFQQPPTPKISRQERRSFGERAVMSQTQSNAYIIEIQDRAAGIVTRDERGFRFFSSERLFDSLEGRQFRSAREAERAARAVFSERSRRAGSQLFAN
jgi:hypothetical protein